MPLKKSQFIDKVPWWVAALVAVAYLVAFIICCAVGSAGPSTASVSNAIAPNLKSALVCDDPRTCSVTWAGGLYGLSGFNQAIWMTAQMQRPYDRSNNQTAPRFALLNAQITMPLVYNMIARAQDQDGSWSQLANVTTVAQINCFAQAPYCSAFLVFAQVGWLLLLCSSACVCIMALFVLADLHLARELRVVLHLRQPIRGVL
jgi:hypothetical protein